MRNRTTSPRQSRNNGRPMQVQGSKPAQINGRKESNKPTSSVVRTKKVETTDPHVKTGSGSSFLFVGRTIVIMIIALASVTTKRVIGFFISMLVDVSMELARKMKLNLDSKKTNFGFMKKYLFSGPLDIATGWNANELETCDTSSYMARRHIWPPEKIVRRKTAFNRLNALAMALIVDYFKKSFGVLLGGNQRIMLGEILDRHLRQFLSKYVYEIRAVAYPTKLWLQPMIKTQYTGEIEESVTEIPAVTETEEENEIPALEKVLQEIQTKGAMQAVEAGTTR